MMSMACGRSLIESLLCMVSGDSSRALTALRWCHPSRSAGVATADGAHEQQRHADHERDPVPRDLEGPDQHDAEADEGHDQPGHHDSLPRMSALHVWSSFTTPQAM